jgi:hypothetical protein
MSNGSSPAILHRRFRKEMFKLPSEWDISGDTYITLKPDVSDFLLTHDYEHQENPLNQLADLKFPITFHLKDSNLYLNLMITGMKQYPFRPPEILLKNRSLKSYYKSNLFIRYGEYLPTPKICCLVCSSILSSSNWFPIANFVQVFYEMLQNFTNIKRSIEMLHMEKICIRNIGDEYLIRYILHFL